MWDYSYMWCCAMFNIHLSVPANFVLFVYSLTLTVFPWWISAFYFFYLFNFFFFPTLLWLFMQPILKAIWISWHWHLGISIDTGKFYFSLTKFFWKIKHDQCNSCAHLFDTSITLLQLPISLWSFFLSIQKHPLLL